MKRYSCWLIMVIVMLTVQVMPALAQIVECPPPPPCVGDVCNLPAPSCAPPFIPGVFTDPEWLKIDYHRVQVDIDQQIATTRVDMQFRNEGQAQAEGTFIFPLPLEASVSQLTMWVNGEAIQANILDRDQARNVYNEIVRRLADPALLEYIGSGAIQANVFPIPPGEVRRIEIEYAQVLPVDNGLVHYVYPVGLPGMDTRSIDEVSINVNAHNAQPVSNIYSPSHSIAVSRDSNNLSFRAGYEATNLVPDTDFSLYYGIAQESIGLNVLTFRESASEDGFFMLMVQPPTTPLEEAVISRDIIVVLDQSGSMDGDKWVQARDAAAYILEHLNPQDRFNAVLFSTGWRVFSNQMESVSVAPDAVQWIRNQEAVGGTDINGALTTAMQMVDPERETTIIFLTDGLPTEGVIEPNLILENIAAASKPNVRVFTFGVGDDVDTFLLDRIVREYNGAGTYVRPTERIDEEVASLYTKISAPVLTNITLDMGGVVVDTLYPAQPLPDLFAGSQLVIVGRYRGEAQDVTVRLSGMVNGQPQTFAYDGIDFGGRAGGDSFIARLWATRRIGDLLNTIRLNGENSELVDSIVRLSVRYGIITPYTSFLITEDDILTQTGMAQAAAGLREEAEQLSSVASGAGAVSAADSIASFEAAAAPMPMATQTAAGTMMPTGNQTGGQPGVVSIDGQIRTINEKTFIGRNGVWTDTLFQPDVMQTTQLVFLSDAYFALLETQPVLTDYFALGDHVIVVYEGVAYEVVPAV